MGRNLDRLVDANGDAITILTGDGANKDMPEGSSFTLRDVDGVKIDITGKVIRGRLVDSLELENDLMDVLATHDSELNGEYSFDLSAENIADAAKRKNAVFIRYEVLAAKNEVIEQNYVDIESSGVS